ncbi:hypothetical protein [Paracoccus pantotrophus]|uniref:hypothetical protein n=1 Tax=Paracoccus pantotrophus TaxID=82367 RepID=UPI0039BFBEA3
MRRAGLEAALRSPRPGDIFVVWQLDRPVRSLASLVQFIEEPEGRCALFRPLAESALTGSVTQEKNQRQETLVFVRLMMTGGTAGQRSPIFAGPAWICASPIRLLNIYARILAGSSAFGCMREALRIRGRYPENSPDEPKQ